MEILTDSYQLMPVLFEDTQSLFHRPVIATYPVEDLLCRQARFICLFNEIYENLMFDSSQVSRLNCAYRGVDGSISHGAMAAVSRLLFNLKAM